MRQRLLALVLALGALLCACAAPAPQTQSEEPAVEIDEEGFFVSGERLYRALEEYRPQSAQNWGDKIQGVIDDYIPEDAAVYYAIVPDKALAGGQDFPTRQMLEDAAAHLSAAQAISLEGLLEAEDYYRTDDHWQQPSLWPVVAQLEQAMGFSVSRDGFTQQRYEEYIGDYAREREGLEPEPLTYLTSLYTQQATVSYYENPLTAVYDTAKLDSAVGYDVFLSGATPLAVIRNPLASRERRLILFRDSYGSALAPLLLEAYREVVLVDLRFLAPQLLPEMVDFSGEIDVLFLQSMRVVNQSAMLK